MTALLQETASIHSAREALRQAGNPFRNYFARNPDDEICARFHVPELFALQRAQLLGLVELDRKSTRLNPSHLVISYAVFCLDRKSVV